MVDTQSRVYVTVYNEQQAYGGPEEGGWHYSMGQPIASVYRLCCGAIESWQEDTWICGDPLDHAEDCPARGAFDDYYRRYVQGHKEAYLKSFTHSPDGVSWLDSDDDPPAEYRGEVATNGNIYVRFEEEPPQSYPQQRPHYE